MIRSIFKTDTNNVTYFILRAALALVILPHGFQKLFGWFGGFGFAGTMDFFTENVGMPWVLGILVIIAETIGMIFLLTGFLSRVVAASIIMVMIGATSTNLTNGFFMNWFGNQAGEGVEFFILAIAMAVPIVLKGGGYFSLDGWLIDNSMTNHSPVVTGKLESSL